MFSGGSDKSLKQVSVTAAFSKAKRTRRVRGSAKGENSVGGWWAKPNGGWKGA